MLLVLPEVSKESCFALHGGTAINLFIREMPRISVDIDLTYTLIENRESSFENISNALNRIKENIERIGTGIKCIFKRDELKLQISNTEAQIKLEVNQAMRGVISPTVRRVLCEKAQKEFDTFCEASIVSIPQLYGGKICQHWIVSTPGIYSILNIFSIMKNSLMKLRKDLSFAFWEVSVPLMKCSFQIYSTSVRPSLINLMA